MTPFLTLVTFYLTIVVPSVVPSMVSSAMVSSAMVSSAMVSSGMVSTAMVSSAMVAAVVVVVPSLYDSIYASYSCVSRPRHSFSSVMSNMASTMKGGTSSSNCSIESMSTSLSQIRPESMLGEAW